MHMIETHGRFSTQHNRTKSSDHAQCTAKIVRSDKNNLFPCLLSMGNISQTIYFFSPWQTSPVATAMAFSMATFSKATITFNQKKQLNINLS